MSDDEKKTVSIEDLPVPLKELDKEEQDNVTGGVGVINPTGKRSPGPLDPTRPNPIIPLNPDLPNPTFNR